MRLRKTTVALLAGVLLLHSACLLNALQPEEEQDLSFLALLGLAAAAGSGGSSPDGPQYEFMETSGTPTLLSSNFYTTGVAGYSIYTNTTVGPSNPAVIVQGEQAHVNATYYVDFLVDGISPNTAAFFTRNSASAGAKKGSMMHPYGADSSIYTSASTSTSYASTQSFFFDAVGPASGVTITYRRVRSKIAATTEETNFSPDSTTSDHKLRGMSKTWGTEKRMKFHLIFVSGANPAASEAGISTAIEKLKTVYTQNTVRIRPIITSTTISAPDYVTLTSLSQDVTTAGSLGGLFVNTASAQNADAVNVIFVKSETAVGGVLGVAGGIPGLPGKTGTRSSAMVVIFDSHLGTPGTAPNTSEQNLMGETIAHEAGHWLGLFHLVESNYSTTQNIWTRDPITETPRCTQSPLNLANCDSTSENNSGARNVMFYTGTSGFNQPDLTGEQGWLRRRNPLAY